MCLGVKGRNVGKYMKQTYLIICLRQTVLKYFKSGGWKMVECGITDVNSWESSLQWYDWIHQQPGGLTLHLLGQVSISLCNGIWFWLLKTPWTWGLLSTLDRLVMPTCTHKTMFLLMEKENLDKLLHFSSCRFWHFGNCRLWNLGRTETERQR